MSNSLQNFLIDKPTDHSPLAIDLAATNINRGRDHGFPSYTAYRQLCGFRNATSFADLNDTMPRYFTVKYNFKYPRALIIMKEDEGDG